VFATASSAGKLAIAKHNGADVLIDYTRQDFVEVVRSETAGRGVDLILEMVGGEVFRQNLRAVRPFGRIVVFGAASGEIGAVDAAQLIFEPVEVSGYHLGVLTEARPDLFGQEILEVQRLIAQSVIQPDEPRAWPLVDGGKAMTELDSRKTTGKLVLVP
jgi:NADPH2:quinone reductase